MVGSVVHLGKPGMLHVRGCQLKHSFAKKHGALVLIDICKYELPTYITLSVEESVSCPRVSVTPPATKPPLPRSLIPVDAARLE